MRPLVSVIVPYYNAARFIAGTIASIEAQNYAPLEIMLVDDGSTDMSAADLQALSPHIHYIRQDNQGPAAARNTALKQAQGELIAFLDADDRWPTGKLDLQVGTLLERPELAFVYGRIQYISLEGAGDAPLFYEDDALKTIVHVHLGAAVMRRAVFETVGLFDEAMRFSEDQDWFMRARERQVPFSILSEITLHYQLHEANMTRNLSIKELGMMAMLKKSIARRRAEGHANSLTDISAFDERKNVKTAG